VFTDKQTVSEPGRTSYEGHKRSFGLPTSGHDAQLRRLIGALIYLKHPYVQSGFLFFQACF
jgi:hypothetical protein